MARVKRADRGEDIVINRDDDGPTEKFASNAGLGSSGLRDREMEGDEEEKIEEEIRQDSGFGAMFGAPSSGGVVGAGEKERLELEKEREREEEADVAEAGGLDVEKEVETEGDVERGRVRAGRHHEEVKEDRRREMDDDPPKNILASDGDDESDTPSAKARYRAKKEAARRAEKGKGRDRDRSRTPPPKARSQRPDPRKEARYCRGTKTWQEGRKVRLPPSFPSILRYRLTPALTDHRRPWRRKCRRH
jgi:hypothetical protein